MTKRAVITGGAGFIGSHTAEEFLANGYEVVVLDNFRTGSRENLKNIIDKIEVVEGDIRDKDLLAGIFKKGDVVVHLAAFVSVPESIENPGESHDMNVNGTNCVFVAAQNAGASRIVAASSAAVYGEPKAVPINESHPLEALSPYALHKMIGEFYGKLYSRLSNTQHVAMRFFNVYGPRQSATGGYAAVIPTFAKKISNDEPALINGDGGAVRDFVYVKDVARALRLAAEFKLESNFEVFNVATGRPITVNELWETLCKVLNKNITPLYGPARAGDIHTSLADVSKARSLLGFEASAEFFEGIKTLFE